MKFRRFRKDFCSKDRDDFIRFFSVFNVGEYRRDVVKFYADKDFFDPDNAGAVAVRK